MFVLVLIHPGHGHPKFDLCVQLDCEVSLKTFRLLSNDLLNPPYCTLSSTL